MGHVGYTPVYTCQYDICLFSQQHDSVDLCLVHALPYISDPVLQNF